jgi:hypothetical protein
MPTDTRPDWYERALSWRGIDDPCPRCGGSGVRVYGDTTTWRRGIGGQSMTTDVCDDCWGTGDRAHKGVDLRRMRNETAGAIHLLRNLLREWSGAMNKRADLRARTLAAVEDMKDF